MNYETRKGYRKGKQGKGGRNRRNSPSPSPPPEFQSIKGEIESLERFGDLKPEKLVGYAEKIGRLLKDGSITTTKLRKFLEAVNSGLSAYRDRPSDFRNDRAVFLKPQLAYAVGREKGRSESCLRGFSEVLFASIDRVGNGEDGFRDYERFVDFFQAVVAYHRYHGGKDA